MSRSETPGFGEVAEKLRRSTVLIYPQGGPEGGSGSGVIWSSGGLILTNAHVARTREAGVELWDGRRFSARVSARDPRRDLAALTIDAPPLDAATPGDSRALRPGELVIAIGNPLGFAGALSTGVVHSIGKQWIYADVRLAPGNSGGPLADAAGRVVGINTAIVNGLGVRALLPHDASPAEIVAAIEAAAAGLAVIDPGELESLVAESPAQPAADPGPLTARELEVLRLLADGVANKNIAWQLQISEHTVKFHVAQILAKLNAGTRTEAVTQGIRRGLILL
jgi:DNA-binding CsgD family transcriptional regulator